MAVELAFNLSRPSWNQGIITEAAAAVLQHALGPLGLNRVEATCMVPNEASARVLAKLGLTYEGLLRQSHQRDGHFVDMKLFAILRSDTPDPIHP